ncbi:MAG: hypothetical protein Q8R24_04710 [Legionellaceae bacterium]|nr:hypothetical protein [Legionellaceae bacterium]
MPTPVESFLKEITGPNGSIDLSTLKPLGGGGTHDIYRSDKYPGLLLKVMRDTTRMKDDERAEHLDKLTGQYSALYEAFGESRCIMEKHSIQSIQSDTNELPQQFIVSVVPFDPCFGSDEKFGFNVESEELNETLIQSKRYLYEMTNKSLLGSNEKSNPYVIRNYPLLNKNFDKIFKLLDTEPSLLAPMREFLTKYKSFYKESGILLDTIGFDNVLFYKNDEGWQFKLGSVIKHDNGALTKEMLEKIVENPATVKESFEYYTSVYYMPACIRALNACAEKVGIEKIIDDISINDKTIDTLAQMHVQLNILKHDI